VPTKNLNNSRIKSGMDIGAYPVIGCTGANHHLHFSKLRKMVC
jgi:hypothetical protein